MRLGKRINNGLRKDRMSDFASDDVRERAMLVVQDVLERAQRDKRWPVLARRNPELFAKVIQGLGDGMTPTQISMRYKVNRGDVYAIRAQAAQHLDQLEELTKQDAQMCLSIGTAMLQEMLITYADQMAKKSSVKSNDLSLVGSTLTRVLELKNALGDLAQKEEEEELTLEKVKQLRDLALKKSKDAQKVSAKVVDSAREIVQDGAIDV